MVWAKIPVALGSILCAACLAVATTTPAAERAADQLAKTVERGVNLKVDLSQLASVNAIPIFQALAAATTPEEILAALGAYGPTSALPFLAAIAQGDLTGIAGLASVNGLVLGPAALSAIPVFLALGAATTPEEAVTALGGYSATSALPAYVALANGDPSALGDLALTSATPAFAQFAATLNTDAFVPAADGSGGYKALSGLSSYRDAAAGNPFALGGIAAFSALNAFAPPPPAGTTLAANNQSGGGTTLAANNQSGGGTTLAANNQSGGGTTLAANNQSGGGTTLAAKGPNNKPSNGSYSASFAPLQLPVLFGSGKGKGPDSGMRGYGAVANGLRAAIGLRPDTSGQGAP